MNSQLSTNKMKVYYKQIKKVKTIRHFRRPNSVFSDFIEDNTNLLNKGFEADKQFMKIHKFIKDQCEAADVMIVLRRYFA